MGHTTARRRSASARLIVDVTRAVTLTAVAAIVLAFFASGALQLAIEVRAQENLSLHQAEQWRDRLIAEDSAQAEWIGHHPGTDIQQLRALIRQARKDAQSAHDAKVAESTGLAPRKGRAYRELFALVRAQLGGAAHAGDEAEAPDEDEPND